MKQERGDVVDIGDLKIREGPISLAPRIVRQIGRIIRNTTEDIPDIPLERRSRSAWFDLD